MAQINRDDVRLHAVSMTCILFICSLVLMLRMLVEGKHLWAIYMATINALSIMCFICLITCYRRRDIRVLPDPDPSTNMIEIYSTNQADIIDIQYDNMV